MSVVLRDLREEHALLPLAAALAVSEACEASAPVECAIKWPNDVWIDGRKVAGILVEGRPQEGWAVLGIGLNVSTPADGFPSELREIATSLAATMSEAPATDQVLAALVERLAVRLGSPLPEVLAEWRRRDALLGSEVRWEGGAGVAAGIDEGGALLVDTDDGRVSLSAGEVHLRR
jgi:BirA family biotin operon repressor/biotin-[acetyl-CoA-carboxylase] ligase